MEKIKELIIEKRPKLSKQSVTTYNSILKNLYVNVFGEDYDVKNFEDSDKILEYLKNLEPNKRKTVLSALVVVTSNKAYRDQMLKDIESFNKSNSLQEKTPDQEKSWVSDNDINMLYMDLQKQAMALYRKPNLNMADLQEIQNFIILCLLGGVYLPPRRSKDFVDFKIKKIDKTVDNYIDKKTLVFNSYKTAKTYGQAVIECPPDLLKIIKKWVKINPTDYLLFDSNGNALSNVKLNQRINKIFGKKVSVNQLRHTYLTGKYGDLIEKNKAMKKDFAEMGSSAAQFETYVKR